MTVPSGTDVDTVVQLKRTFVAPREKVFQAWTDPEKLKKWWGPEHCSAPVVQIDLRVGGRYRFGMQCQEEGIFYLSGVYREIQPPEKLVFTWQWESAEMGAGETLVTVEFNARGGLTEVVLTHQGFPNREVSRQHDQGWRSTFAALARAVEGKED